MARSTTSFRLTNTSRRVIDFVLEPWGEIYKMPAGATYEVLSTPANAKGLEVEVAADAIIVYAAPESTISVTYNGRELGDLVEDGRPRPRKRRTRTPALA